VSLTRGHGPLATPGPEAVNYAMEGPGHRLLLHPFPRRVRAEVGGETVLDTERGQLLHESNLLPVLYVPLEDVRRELLEPTSHRTFCPFKGHAAYWTVRAGGEVRENAVWGYPEPLDDASWLQGLVAFYPDRLDRWLDEDEPVRGHLRDPYHRVDVRRSSRAVRVRAGDEVLAESSRARLLSETGLPNRYYVPLEDVRAVLSASDTRTHCPYKGDARYFHVGGMRDAAWTYDAPFDGVQAVAGHVCFDGEGISLEAS
jgi:uncharacterized protein (DUF427 family)